MQRFISGALAGLLAVGCLSLFFVSSPLPAHAHTLDFCPFVLATTAGDPAIRPIVPRHGTPTVTPTATETVTPTGASNPIQTCIKPGPPVHISHVIKICSLDPIGEFLVLFGDENTHKITAIRPGQCASFNDQSGLLGIA